MTVNPTFCIRIRCILPCVDVGVFYGHRVRTSLPATVSLDIHIPGNSQAMTQSAGRQAVHSGCTCGSSPNPTPDRRGGGADSNQVAPGSSTTAAPLNPVPGSSSSHEKKAASRAKFDGDPQEQASTTAPGPKSPKKGVSRRVGPSPGRRVWACAECGITANMLDSGKLRECSGCGTVRYCGKACQKAHWPAHKPACKRLQAARR
jgi:hypothetical protein